jgi:hypothetical protein
MGGTTNRNPARRLDDASSLAGLLEFRPRLAVVLLFLTLMVAVVGWRIARDTGVRRVDLFAREAIVLFDAAPSTGTGTAPPDAADAEKRFRALGGVPIEFPRDDPDFAPVEVRKVVFANHPATSLRFRYGGEGYLLVGSSGPRPSRRSPRGRSSRGSGTAGRSSCGSGRRPPALSFRRAK